MRTADHNIGSCFSRLNKEVEAQDWYRRGFGADTQGILWEHAWHLGKELLKKSDYTAALEFLAVARAKAAQQNRRDVRIHRDLALTYYALDRFTDAWKEIGVVKEFGYDLQPEFVDKVQPGLKGNASRDP